MDDRIYKFQNCQLNKINSTILHQLQMIKTFQFNPQDKLIQDFPSQEIKVDNESQNKAYDSIQHLENSVDLDTMKIYQGLVDRHHNINQKMYQSSTLKPPQTSNQPHQKQRLHSSHVPQANNQNIKKTLPSASTKVFREAKKILNKSPEIRTPTDNQTLLQLIEYNEFLSKLVEKVGIQCFKGLMKQAKIQEVRERQMLCQQNVPITHIVILLDGKLVVCKQQDEFTMGLQRMKTPRTPRTPLWKLSAMADSIFLPPKSQAIREKQSKTMQTVVNMENIFDELSILSCKQIENLRKKNAVIRRKSSIPLSPGMFLPPPFSKQQFETYEVESYVNPGEEYGARLRCRNRIHTNTCIAVENSVLLIIDFNLLIYWFEHSYREKLGKSIEKLKNIPAFSFLEDAKLMECILYMKKEKKRRNDFIYKQGSPSDKLYILLSGEVKLSKQAKLFEQNPNDLYVDRRKLMRKGPETNQKQDQSNKINILRYANFTSLYNFRPMKKNIELGIITSNDNFSLLGEEELIEKRPRETSVQVISLECQYYEIEIKKIQELLGSKFIEDFYRLLQKSMKKVILYRQNQYAGKVNLENRQNLDYFYYENDKSKESPRKYKLEKINNKFSDTPPVSQIFVRSMAQDSLLSSSVQDEKMKPYYTTFNFHKLMKTERSSYSHKPQENDNKPASSRKRKDSQDSQDVSKMKFDAVQERLIDMSHTWKPIKKKVIQEIKVMQKISAKRHSININEPLIEQKYFQDVQKQQKRINREHKIFKLSLGKRTNW